MIFEEDEDGDEDFYDEGSYCYHWGDLDDCDEIWMNCGHTYGCECEEFIDDEEY